MKRRNAEDRFWSFVGPPDDHGCRMWLGARHHVSNYGVFKLRMGKQVQAHAFAWRVTYQGPLLPNSVFMHSCDVHHPPGSKTYRPCCEPSHVYPGTPRANVLDAAAKNRMSHGDRHRGTRLPDSMLRIVLQRLDAGERQVDIARDLGVTQITVSRIKRGQRKAQRSNVHGAVYPIS